MKHRVTTGWFRPGGKTEKTKHLITMICLGNRCGHLWDAKRASDACPKCGSNAVVPASKWNFDKQGAYRLGTVRHGR